VKKKIAIALIVFFTGLSFASSESGKTYMVKKGDSVYRIAAEVFRIPWGDVRPEMRKENIIYPGQKFSLSDFLDLSEEKIWKSYNVKPFKKFSAKSEKQLERDRKGLEILGLNEKEIKEVMKKHTEAVNGSQEGFRWDRIETGDKFEQILFGEFLLWRNVRVDWKGKCQAARVYGISSGKEVWYPVTCGNWTVKKVKKFALRPPPIPPIPPPPPVGRIAIQKILLAQYQHYRWDWDSTWGGFNEQYDDGNHVKGWWQTTAWYPLIIDDMDGNQWSFGLAYTTRRWQGATGEADPFHYKGYVDIGYLAGRFRDTDRKWEVLARAGIGQRDDIGYLTNKWGRYDAEQQSDLFSFYTSAEYNGRYDKMFLSKIRGSAEIELAYNEEKSDFWTDQWSGRQPRDGRADDKNMYSAALYADILNLYNKDFQIWGEARTTYYPEGYKWGNSIRGGFNFFNDSFKVGIGYTLWNNPNANSRGWYAELSPYQIWHRIFGYVEDSADARFQKIEQEKKEKEILDLLGGASEKKPKKTKTINKATKTKKTAVNVDKELLAAIAGTM